MEKGSVPLDTYYVDHLGPLANTGKMYNHLLVVVDAFSKFVFLGEFESYCKESGIEHQLVTTGIPRGNGQSNCHSLAHEVGRTES